MNWESVAGSVIQANGTVEFEDGLWIGSHLKARNGLQRVCTIPGVQPGAVRTPGFLCLGPRGCLVLSQAPGSILGSRGVRIDPA